VVKLAKAQTKTKKTEKETPKKGEVTLKKGLRPDGRKADKMRPIEAKVGVLENADGSAMFKIGDTIAIAGVYGPKELHPKFLQNPEKGVLRCKYDMMSFSVSERKRMGPSRRSKELGMVIGFALEDSIFLENFPKTVIEIHMEIIQANAGTRCACISAASLALADAGIPMKGLVSSIAAGRANGMIVLDITKEEEDAEDATDIPIAYSVADDKITLLQLDGDIDKEELKEAVALAVKGCKEIYEIQAKALRDKYKREE
jgi:exosome complex component RRP41